MQTGVGLSPGDGWAVKINKLLYDTSYQQFIASVAKIQVAKGHRVLIVADRVEFLQNVKELIGEECVCVTGDTDFETRKRIKKQVNSGEKTSVAGSRQIISEGWSVNSLSCVILAGPISAPSEADGLLEQVVGRIQRNFPGKLEPLVLDMNFNDPPSRKQNLERLNFYKRQGWEIKS
jgi:superfamily II DNA or RNA helicase